MKRLQIGHHFASNSSFHHSGQTALAKACNLTPASPWVLICQDHLNQYQAFNSVYVHRSRGQSFDTRIMVLSALCFVCIICQISWMQMSPCTSGVSSQYSPHPGISVRTQSLSSFDTLVTGLRKISSVKNGHILTENVTGPKRFSGDLIE